MNEKNNEKKKNHNRHHGRNHNRGRNNEQKKAKAPQEQAPEIILPEFDFIAPEPKKEEPKVVNTDDIVLSDEVLAKIDEDIIPPIDRIVERSEKEEPVPDDLRLQPEAFQAGTHHSQESSEGTPGGHHRGFRLRSGRTVQGRGGPQGLGGTEAHRR